MQSTEDAKASFTLCILTFLPCDETQVRTGSFLKAGRSILLAEKPRVYQAELCSPDLAAMPGSYLGQRQQQCCHFKPHAHSCWHGHNANVTALTADPSHPVIGWY